MKRQKTMLLVSATAVIFSICTHSQAQGDQEAETVLPVEQAPARQANIDPVTGELSAASAANTQSATQTTNTKRLPIEYITHPDGTVEGDLNGWFQSNLNVTLGCDGELDTKHSDQPIEARSRCVESD